MNVTLHGRRADRSATLTDICAPMGFLVALALTLGAACSRADSTADLWLALATPGHFGMIRHAIAPGTGDPSNFQVDDCSTQRNLSAEGRSQARRLGERFRQHGLDNATVYASQWCRCMETARLLALGDVHPLPALNSFFGQPDRASRQSATLRAWITTRPSAPLILVTHQVNITAMTGVYPAAGELVVVQRQSNERLRVLGTIRTD